MLDALLSKYADEGIAVGSSSPDPRDFRIFSDEASSAHEVLGIPRNASVDKVRAAYIRLAKDFHPDANPGDPAAEMRFKRITKAYNELRPAGFFAGVRTSYRTDHVKRSHARVLTMAVLLFVATPAAILLLTRGGENPDMDLRLADRTASGTQATGAKTAALDNRQLERQMLLPQQDEKSRTAATVTAPEAMASKDRRFQPLADFGSV